MDEETPDHLRFCEGCQTNVAPVFGTLGPECPQCGTSFGGLVSGGDLDLDTDTSGEPITSSADGLPDLEDATLTSIDTQTLTINPKVDADPLDLRCPDCGEVIQAIASAHAVEYRCGCDQLRRFRIRGEGEG